MDTARGEDELRVCGHGGRCGLLAILTAKSTSATGWDPRQANGAPAAGLAAGLGRLVALPGISRRQLRGAAWMITIISIIGVGVALVVLVHVIGAAFD